MTTNKGHNIRNLLNDHIPETVLLASWLEKRGFSYNLQQYYLRSGWLESIGTGAFKRPNESVNWKGGLYALQYQVMLPVHAGAITALSLQGLSHYLRLDQGKVFIFSELKLKIPAWYKKYKWGVQVEHCRTSLFPSDIGIMEFEDKNFTIRVSAPERAILECLYLAPDELDLMECYQTLEGLVNLRPKLLQDLLEKCNSIKVKRLFLLMADKAKHQWFPLLNKSSLSLGNGARHLIKGGKYNPAYHINVPKELA